MATFVSVIHYINCNWKICVAFVALVKAHVSGCVFCFTKLLIQIRFFCDTVQVFATCLCNDKKRKQSNKNGQVQQPSCATLSCHACSPQCEAKIISVFDCLYGNTQKSVDKVTISIYNCLFAPTACTDPNLSSYVNLSERSAVSNSDCANSVANSAANSVMETGLYMSCLNETMQNSFGHRSDQRCENAVDDPEENMSLSKNFAHLGTQVQIALPS